MKITHACAWVALRALECIVSRQEEEAKRERIELLRRQMVRRIMNRDISMGFTAWVDMWEAKAYAMSRLREVGNKLRAPELSSAFDEWADQFAEAAQRDKLKAVSTRTVIRAHAHAL